MGFFTKITFWSLKKKKYDKTTKLLKINTSNVGLRLNWNLVRFFVIKINQTISPKTKNNFKFKKHNLIKDELFSFKLLINNFCSNGKFLKYYTAFLDVFVNLNTYMFDKLTVKKLSGKGWDSLLFFLKFLKGNLLLSIPTYFMYFLFSKNEILFFAKTIKLNKRLAKKKKKKYVLGFEYIIPKKRFSKVVKFWKYYLNYVSKSLFKKKIFKGILQLIINYKKSILTKYRKRVIKLLIAQKKMEF